MRSSTIPTWTHGTIQRVRHWEQGPLRHTQFNTHSFIPLTLPLSLPFPAAPHPHRPQRLRGKRNLYVLHKQQDRLQSWRREGRGPLQDSVFDKPDHRHAPQPVPSGSCQLQTKETTPQNASSGPSLVRGWRTAISGPTLTRKDRGSMQLTELYRISLPNNHFWATCHMRDFIEPTLT